MSNHIEGQAKKEAHLGMSKNSGAGGLFRHGKGPAIGWPGLCMSGGHQRSALMEQQALVTLLIGVADHDFELLVAHHGVAALGVEGVHLLLDRCHQRVLLAHGIFALETEIAVEPVSDTGQSAVAVHGHGGGTVENGGGIEDVVDFLILEHAVGVDAGALREDAFADDRAVGGNADAGVGLDHAADVVDLRLVDAGGAVQAVVQDGDRTRQRCVPGPLAQPVYRDVDPVESGFTAAAVLATARS